jgi:hypothetical protein
MQEHMEASEVRKLLDGGYVGPRPAKQPLDSLEIELPIPPQSTHPNSRGAHWSKKAKGVAQQREDAATMAGVVLRQLKRAAPQWERVTVQATFYKPGNRARPMDSDNLIAWLKGTMDGLQDAGIVKNDSGTTWLPPVQLLGADAEERKLVLVIEPLTPAP